MTFQKGTADFVSVLLITIGLGYLFYYTSTFPPSMLPGYPGDAFFPVLFWAFRCFFAHPLFFAGVKNYSLAALWLPVKVKQ